MAAQAQVLLEKKSVASPSFSVVQSRSLQHKHVYGGAPRLNEVESPSATYPDRRIGHDFARVQVFSNRRTDNGGTSGGTAPPSPAAAAGAAAGATAGAAAVGATGGAAAVGATAGATAGAAGVSAPPACANPGVGRDIALQPIFFKSSNADPNPTGLSWSSRLTSSQQIWRKLGITIRGLSALTLVDAPSKTGGSTEADANRIGALRSGSGIEVYCVDNDMSSSGGASTLSAGDASNIVMADRGTSSTLLAHELGHVFGLGHPPGGADANTVMQPSGSHSSPNPTRNTMGNYNRLTFPAANASVCLSPDP
jgi:hypothetical protein